MKKIWIPIIVVIIIVAAIVIFYKPTPKGTIKIGAIISLTGNYQQIGQQMKDGIILAQDEINAGSINKKVEIVFEDSQNNPQVGLTAYRKLTDTDGVKIFLVAHSNVSRAVSEVAQKDGNLVFNIYAVSPGITEVGNNIFRNDIAAKDEAMALSDFVKMHNYKKIALLFVNSDGSIAIANYFKEYFSQNEAIVFNERYDLSENDFRTQLLKIKRSNADLIFAIAAPKQMGWIIKRASELKMSIPLISTFHCEGNDLISVAGNLADGLIYTHAVDLNSQEPLIKNYVDNFKLKFNLMPDYKSALAYDSIKILFNSVFKCPQDDMGCIKNNLLKIKDFQGITGLTTINKDRDTQKNIILKTIKNGQFVPLEN